MLAFFIEHSALIFGILFGLSELLSKTSLKSNSVFELVVEILKTLSVLTPKQIEKKEETK